jgi:hypothetical protein
MHEMKKDRIFILNIQTEIEEKRKRRMKETNAQGNKMTFTVTKPLIEIQKKY